MLLMKGNASILHTLFQKVTRFSPLAIIDGLVIGYAILWRFHDCALSHQRSQVVNPTGFFAYITFVKAIIFL